MDDLPFGEIETFLRVVDTGSFTAAARALGTSKSSVSRRVTRLEARLGVPLLARTTRTLRPTEEGAAFHARVSRAVTEVAEAAQALRELQETPRGHVRVTAPTDLGGNLGKVVAAFGEAYPEVSVELFLTQRVVDVVGEGFDLALRAGPARDSSLVARRLDMAGPQLVASPGYLAAHPPPVHPADLVDHACLLFGVAHRQRWVLHGAGGTETVEVTGRLSTNTFDTLLAMAEGDAGIGFLPALYARPALAAGRLVPVLEAWSLTRNPILLVYPAGRRLTAKVRVLSDFLVDWMTHRMGVGEDTVDPAGWPPDGAQGRA